MSRVLDGLTLAASILTENPEVGDVSVFVATDGNVIFTMSTRVPATERVLRFTLLADALSAERRDWNGGHPWRAAHVFIDGHEVDVTCPLTPAEQAELMAIRRCGVTTDLARLTARVENVLFYEFAGQRMFRFSEPTVVLGVDPYIGLLAGVLVAAIADELGVSE